MSKKVILLLVILLGLLLLVDKFISSSKMVQNLPSTAKEKSQTIDTSSFRPFEDMTIPYLRHREYKSKLNDREFLSEHDTYSSYLTSYNSDGLRVNGLLTVPKGEEPKNGWPAIVFVHGYIPPDQYQTTEKYVDYVDYLARNGYVVFKIDLRGHGDSEGEAGGGYFGSDYIVDTLNAYAALESADFVNSNAIGLWGHSMSGNTILRSMVIRPSIPAGVIWAGAVYSYIDLQQYGITDRSYQAPKEETESQRKRREMLDKYGRPSAESPFWQQVIPTNFVNDMKGAIQVHHAKDDNVVPIGYSRNLITILDKTDVPHTLYEYDTGGHNIAEPSFSIAMQRTVEFFDEQLM